MEHIKLTIRDGLTANNVKLYEQQLSQILEETDAYKELVFDLAKTENIDSMGVTFVISVYKKMKAIEKGFRVTGASEDVMRLFRLMKLDQFFEMSQ